MARGELSLKREVVRRKPEPPRGPFSAASVIVDSSVYHLDQPFTYLIPGNLSASAAIGTLVTIPFNGREMVGLIVELLNPEDLRNLKSIAKVISTIPPISHSILELILEGSRLFAAHPFDLLRSAIPDRVIAKERNFLGRALPEEVRHPAETPLFLQLPPAKDRYQLIAEKVQKLSQSGGVIVLIPESRELDRLASRLGDLSLDFITLDSQLQKSARYENFLRARFGDCKIILGTRSAIFTPLPTFRHLVVIHEGSENFYEKRSPGWNVRQLSLLRHSLQGGTLSFIGYSPSPEISAMIEKGEVIYKRSPGKVKVEIDTPIHGEILPSKAIPSLKSALKLGPVLFLAPMKGYAQAIRCSKCRAISRCECGGAHIQSSQTSPITCLLCSKEESQWSCKWCSSSRSSLMSRGAERHHHEIGLLFPGVPSHLSTADHPIDAIESGMVIATPGMAPATPAGYAAVVILEGDRFLSQPDLKAPHRVREMYFSLASMLMSTGKLHMVQESYHSIATVIGTWNPIPAISRELEEMKAMSLPPFTSALSMSMGTSEILKLQRTLIQARDEGRVPGTTRILGPILDSKSRGVERSSLILMVEDDHRSELVGMIHEFMRRRSAAHKELPTLRIDPYSL